MVIILIDLLHICLNYNCRYLTKVKTDRNFTSNLAVGEIDTDCMFSNDYEDECQTVCKICERSLNYGNLGSHLYQSHSSRMKDYVEQHGEQAQAASLARTSCMREEFSAPLPVPTVLLNGGADPAAR